MQQIDPLGLHGFAGLGEAIGKFGPREFQVWLHLWWSSFVGHCGRASAFASACSVIVSVFESYRLQVINRDAHATKCLSEAQARRSKGVALNRAEFMLLRPRTIGADLPTTS